MTEKRFDFEDEYITLDGGVFATAKNKGDAELISKTLNQLYDENEQLKQSIYIMGGRLQGLWANYYENRWGMWSEAVEDIANELGFKIHHAYDEPISNSESKKERVEGVKKITEILGENELIKKQLKIYKNDGLETLNDLERAYENNKKALNNIEQLYKENDKLKSRIEDLEYQLNYVTKCKEMCFKDIEILDKKYEKLYDENNELKKENEQLKLRYWRTYD